jgi:integrase
MPRGYIGKKPSGRYYIKYDIGVVWDEERERHRRKQKEEVVSEPNTRKHAEKLLTKRLGEIDRGEFIEPSNMLFRDFAKKWLETYAKGQVKPGTAEDYKGYMANHLNPAFGEKPVSRITVEDVQRFRAKKLAEEYAPQTVKHLLRLLRQMLNHAVDWGYVSVNPATKVKDPRVSRGEMDFLRPEEARKFLSAAPVRWYPFFLTAISTGLRLGELLAMKWGNLDWASERYFVRETLSRARYAYEGGFTSPKTEGSAQSVDLTAACLDALRDHHQRQAEEKLKVGEDYGDLDLVFATPKGTPLDQKNIVHRQFYSALESAGLRRIRFHDLRHTCASLLINQGISPKYIQRQLRHASIDTTFDRYGHLFPETNQEATQKLDAILVGGDPTEEGRSSAAATA